MSRQQTQPKWLRELLRQPEHAYWSADLRSQHIRLVSPQASGPVFVAKTPSDRRAVDNIISTMRRRMKVGNHV